MKRDTNHDNREDTPYVIHEDGLDPVDGGAGRGPAGSGRESNLSTLALGEENSSYRDWM